MDTHDIDRIARKRAGAKLGWYVHALAFLAVNALLAMLSAASGRHWAVFPAAGWFIGLAIHGMVVFLATGRGFEQMVQRERERLALQRDPW